MVRTPVMAWQGFVVPRTDPGDADRGGGSAFGVAAGWSAGRIVVAVDEVAL
jgi:hypothetical protein